MLQWAAAVWSFRWVGGAIRGTLVSLLLVGQKHGADSSLQCDTPPLSLLVAMAFSFLVLCLGNLCSFLSYWENPLNIELLGRKQAQSKNWYYPSCLMCISILHLPHTICYLQLWRNHVFRAGPHVCACLGFSYLLGFTLVTDISAPSAIWFVELLRQA